MLPNYLTNIMTHLIKNLQNGDRKTQNIGFAIGFGALIIITLLIAHTFGVRIDWRA